MAIPTNALFIDQAINENSFKAGTWWDKSKLKFVKPYDDCDCKSINAYMENIGEGDMIKESKFEVYQFSSHGFYTMKDDGHFKLHDDVVEKIDSKIIEKVHTGVIEKMDANDPKQKLSFEPENSGVYIFVAYQHPKKPIHSPYEIKIDEIPVAISTPIVFKECRNSNEEDKKEEHNEKDDKDKKEANREEDDKKKEAVKEEENKPVTEEKQENKPSDKPENNKEEEKEQPAEKQPETEKEPKPEPKENLVKESETPERNEKDIEVKPMNKTQTLNPEVIHKNEK
ncbi:hypothetical protein [Bacillus sp. V5-8f]|uniref:hypothetical protein n=1 Tax=Bacillus sp. V5-8f TaxID=2053044 RepID=UPI000C76E84E|nr:hypothetical protein [Bacillus sp. V5-8f]PLT35575.1 hypothetical protein CUU64_02930 [Bacillus sp. V5-8f]